MEKKISRLSDLELERRIKFFVAKERGGLVRILRLLSEFEVRRLHAKRSYSTLFDYCVQGLGYSEGAAIRRVFASRTARKYPMVARWIEKGRISLSTVYLLTPHICKENCADLLRQTAGLSKREVERIIAAMKDDKPVLPRETIRALGPVIRRNACQTDATAPALDLKQTTSQSPSNSFDLKEAPVQSSAEMTDPVKLSESVAPARRYSKVTLVVEDELLNEVERLKEVMRGKFPNNSLADVFAAGVAALMEKHDPERRIQRRKARDRRAAEKHPVANKSIPKGRESASRKRHIPETVKNEVWNRDGGRCSYRSSGGRRCATTKRLEYDHILPWALGGKSDSADGIRLLCKPHNNLEARRMLGDSLVDRALLAARA